MGRISTYPKDTYVTGLDKWIGSDANTENFATKNFTANAVADYFNRSAIIDTGSFSWTYAPYSNTQAQAEKSFQQIDHVAQNINIINLADELLRVSALTLANTTPKTFIVNEWVGQSILVHVPSAPSQYAIYNVIAVTPDTEWFFLIDLEFVSGISSNVLEGESLVFGFWSGANIVTSVEGTFPIIVTGDNDVVISLDTTVKNTWDTAYNRSLVSATVTGTTTKTLTLNKQDGGTITASWVDQNTDAVVSVFGRIGAIVAQAGDYTTTLVTEGTNLYFTTSRARLSVSAVTPLFYNNSTGEFTIQVANATQSGYLSSADWNTFNGKQPFITAGTTSQYWRGDKTWQNLTTTVVTEGTNLYFTDQRARSVISSSIEAITYANTTGIFSLTTGYLIPTTTKSGQWDTAYNRSLTSAAVTGTTTKTLTLNQQDGGTITASWSDDNTNLVTSVFTRTGAVTAQSGDYTTTLVTEGDNLYFTTARARTAISLTTTGTSGAATYSSSTGILNIPNYQSGVTSFNTRTGAITLTSTDVTDALGFTPENVANKSNDTALGTSATLYPTQNAVKVYVDSATAGGIILQGDWNAATNVPNITGTTQTGFAWRVSVAGNTNLGGITDWLVNDLAVKTATGWIKIDNTESVTSVFGRFGTVVSQTGDYTSDQVTEGTTNLYFTTARARASISAGSGIAYNSTTGVISSTSGGGSVTSVGLSMPSAFTVTNSPVTTAGTLTVTGAGTTAQYIRGDGSLATLPGTSAEARSIVREVYNKTGATLTKGTVVYINSGQGNLPAVTKAIATGDMTSAQTFGIVQTDITDQNNGFVIVTGGLENLDTQGLGVGTQLYLSSTVAGAYTTVKQYAPAHLVYVAIVVRDHPTQGVIEVNIQNGYELDELHNVAARFPVNNDIIAYNTTTSLWENKSIATTLGYTPANAATTLTINGTGYDLSTNRSWSVGTVTSVGLSLGTTGTDANISNSPITSTGSITLNLPTASASNRGLLSNGDWTTFNSKQGTITLTTNLSSGSSTLIGNTLNIPTYTLSGLGGQPLATNLTSLSGLTFASTSFVKMTAAGTFALDTNTYLTTGTAASTYLPLSGGTLTGALGGTSATFSGNVTLTGTDSRIPGGDSVGRLVVGNSSTSTYGIFYGATHATSANVIFFANNSAPTLTLNANNTATFSSSVTAGAIISTGVSTFSRTGLVFTLNPSYAGGDVYSQLQSTGALALASGGDNNRLYITSAGNVGIGTTSPSYKFDVQNGSDFDIRLRDTSLGGTVGILFETANDFSGTSQAYIKGIGAGNSGVSQLIFGTAGSSGDTSATERMRINSAGNVLVATTSSTASVFTFQVGNGSADTRAFFNPNNPYSIGLANGGSSAWYIGVNAQTAANGLQFYSNELGSAAMTIRTTGNVLIGTTADTGQKLVVSSGNTLESSAHLHLVNPNFSGYHWLDATAYWIGQNSNFRQLRMYSGSNIYSGVYLAAGGTSWTAYSDERMKTDLLPIEMAVDKVSKLRAVTGRYKTDDESKRRSFLIAQDVKEVLPEAVTENNDKIKSLGVQYTDIIPLLVASIKELKQEIDLLKQQ